MTMLHMSCAKKRHAGGEVGFSVDLRLDFPNTGRDALRLLTVKNYPKQTFKPKVSGSQVV